MGLGILNQPLMFLRMFRQFWGHISYASNNRERASIAGLCCSAQTTAMKRSTRLVKNQAKMLALFELIFYDSGGLVAIKKCVRTI
jgi:hypothetical protein